MNLRQKYKKAKRRIKEMEKTKTTTTSYAKFDVQHGNIHTLVAQVIVDQDNFEHMKTSNNKPYNTELVWRFVHSLVNYMDIQTFDDVYTGNKIIRGTVRVVVPDRKDY